MSDRQLASSYLLEASEAEHARLARGAQHGAEAVRDLCARAGVGEGARVVDIGCGPIGALADLAEIVGPDGSVVGIDSSDAAVQTAQTMVSRRGMKHVQVVHGDINTLDAATVTGGRLLDAAHMRAVLIHQPDPALTLRRAATLVRAGGHILVSEIVTDPRYPSFDPPLPVQEKVWEMLYTTARRRGATIDAARRLPQLCEEAGLRVVDARGAFRLVANAKEPIEATLTALQSARRAVVENGVATDAEVESLLEQLRGALNEEFRGVLGYLAVHAIAQVP